ncbi:Protein of unknown function wound-induced [Dillenia turbinata]|uniref:Uncharacterized protein n=1 Tax=Dillenia turbinata TaxID=194707 RepID=A0AAN8UR43_9MAGN
MSLRHMSRVCVRAIQGLREYTQKKSSNTMSSFKASQTRPRAEPTGSDQVRWVSSAAVEPAKNSVIVDEKRRFREAEKAEKVMHLICWGPN